MKTLAEEMARGGVTVQEIQGLIGETWERTQDKVSGRVAFTLREALMIRDSFFPGLSMEYLFSSSRAAGKKELGNVIGHWEREEGCC